MEEILAMQEHRDGDVCVVHPIGEVDMQTMRPLRELVRRLPDEGVRYLILDLRDVTFLDSAGMSVLFGAKKRLASDHGECYVVTTAEGFVAQALKTIAIEKVMPHIHHVDDAMEDIRQRKEGRATRSAEADRKAHEDWAVDSAEREEPADGDPEEMTIAPGTFQIRSEEAGLPIRDGW